MLLLAVAAVLAVAAFVLAVLLVFGVLEVPVPERTCAWWNLPCRVEATAEAFILREIVVPAILVFLGLFVALYLYRLGHLLLATFVLFVFVVLALLVSGVLPV